MVPGRGIRSVSSPPTGNLPISLEEAKDFVRETTDNEKVEGVINNLLTSGFIQLENYLQRAIRRQRRKWEFPYVPAYKLSLEPFDENAFEIYRAVEGQFIPLSFDDFALNGIAGEVFAIEDGEHGIFKLPEGEWVAGMAYRVIAVCGFQVLPEDLKIGVLMYVKDLYDKRGVRDIGRPITKPWLGLEHYSWRYG